MISDYILFQAKLYPVLPFLIFQAANVRKSVPKLPSISENIVLGKGDRKLLILGESTAAGIGASEPKFTLAGHLNSLLDKEYQIYNLGKKGLRVSQALPLLDEQLNLKRSKFDGVLLFLGANDCFRLTHPSQFKVDMGLLIKQVKANFAPDWIYLADIPPVQHFPAFPKLLQSYLNTQRSFLQKEMIEISQNQDDILFDKITLEINAEFFASDLIHPSDIGYLKIVEFALDGLGKKGFIKLN